MSLTDLAGHTYGPFVYRTDPEKFAEYAALVGAVADGPPRSIAGALLFAVAPHLLADERAAQDAVSVIHGDQSFTWHAAIPPSAALEVSGTVTRVRERSGVFFTGFDLAVEASGGTVLTGTSTFLMTGAGTAPAGGAAEHAEPTPGEGSVSILGGTLTEEETEMGRFAASRSDLVRYAGAARDWNPIHWDHEAAVAAGLGGIVVHGLFQSGWVIEAAVRLGLDFDTARFRYRRPLAAGVVASLTGRRTESGTSLELGDDGGAYLAATFG